MEEAEAQCALLNSELLCDGCFSLDSDIFLFGARTVYRDICLGDGGYVVCYEMADIETKLGFGRDSLMPVKCPVSEIIKTRRVQGRDCYEVSWEEMDGLETSIVPADLIQSACPEKISEFEEKKAQGKKQNIQKRRQKKKETQFSVAELDLKLQSLLLDDDLGDQANLNARESSGRILTETSDMAEADLDTSELLSHDIEHNEWILNSSTVGGKFLIGGVSV